MAAPKIQNQGPEIGSLRPDFNFKANGRPLFAIDLYVCKSRGTNQFNPSRGQITPRNGNGLDRLIDSSSTNGLEFAEFPFADHTRDCTGNGRGLRR